VRSGRSLSRAAKPQTTLKYAEEDEADYFPSDFDDAPIRARTLRSPPSRKRRHTIGLRRSTRIPKRTSHERMLDFF
jgi:hypothetical protein